MECCRDRVLNYLKNKKIGNPVRLITITTSFIFDDNLNPNQITKSITSNFKNEKNISNGN